MREAAILGIRSGVQMRVIATVWLIDAGIAPLGVLVADAARPHPAEMLLLLPVFGVMFALSRERTARIDQARRRLDLILTDPLTRLGNRRKLMSDLDDLLLDPVPSRPVVLLMFDLDGFKSYNDTFGHPAGDAVLARLGAKLADCGRGPRLRLPARRRRVLRAAQAISPAVERRRRRRRGGARGARRELLDRLLLRRGAAARTRPSNLDSRDAGRRRTDVRAQARPPRAFARAIRRATC